MADDEMVLVDGDGEPLPPDHRYDAHVSLSPADVQATFANDPHVAWYPHANPPAFGMPGAPAFEAWPAGPSSIVVRKHVPASLQLASPYVLIEWTPTDSGGSAVRARFVRTPPGALMSQQVRTFVVAVLGLSVLMMVGYIAWLPLMLLHPGVWATIAACIGGIVVLSRYSKNRPSAESMHAFGSPLWALVGNKFVPHVVGEGEDPFRLKALGSSRK